MEGTGTKLDKYGEVIAKGELSNRDLEFFTHLHEFELSEDPNVPTPFYPDWRAIGFIRKFSLGEARRVLAEMEGSLLGKLGGNMEGSFALIRGSLEDHILSFGKD